MQRTTFQSRSHGFHFRNSDIRWSFGLSNGTQLCGGLAFGSLDHYYYRIAIPADFNPPAEGTPLHNYIVTRQMDAHQYAIPRLIGGDQRFNGTGFELSVRQDRNFGIIKNMIDRGRPVPVLLSSARSSLSTGSHWVVATGYESLPGSEYGCPVMQKIFLYDSNRPEVESELTADWTRRTLKIRGGRAEYGYFAPYDAYEALNPSLPAVFGRRPNATGLASNPFRLPGSPF